MIQYQDFHPTSVQSLVVPSSVRDKKLEVGCKAGRRKVFPMSRITTVVSSSPELSHGAIVVKKLATHTHNQEVLVTWGEREYRPVQTHFR